MTYASTSFKPGFFKRLAGIALLAAALPSVAAAGYTFALAPGSLLLGGSISGSFAGADADHDGTIMLAELSSFQVSYLVPGGGFSIVGSPLSFAFDTTTDQLVFAATDAASDSVTVNTYDGGSYSVLGANGPDAGAGALAITAVPEASTWALLGVGLTLLAACPGRPGRPGRSGVKGGGGRRTE